MEELAGLSLEEAYEKYRRLVAYYARLYGKPVGLSEEDVSDIEQEAYLLLISIWRRPDVVGVNGRHALFVASLRLFTMRTVSKLLKTRNSTYSIDAPVPGSERIDLKELLEASDCQTLAVVYAREFSREIRRLLDADCRMVLDYLTGDRSIPGIDMYSRRRLTQWAKAVGAELNMTVPQVRARITEIKKLSVRLLAA